MNITVLYIILLVFTITTWGYSWVLMKMGLGYSEPFTFAAWRCAIGAVSMMIYLSLRPVKWPTLKKLPDYIAIGLFQTTFMFGLMLYGMKYVTAGKTSVLLYTMPIWTILLVNFYLKEKLSSRKWIGVTLGTAGIICILGWDTLVNQNLTILMGELLILAGAVSWAVSNIWIKKRMVGEDIYAMSGLQLAFGALGLVLLAAPTEGVFNVDWNAHSIYILLFTGIIASAVDFTIWFYLLKKMDISILTFSSMLVPVFGLLFDWLLLGSPLDPGIIVGGLLILSGIYKVSKA